MRRLRHNARRGRGDAELQALRRAAGAGDPQAALQLDEALKRRGLAAKEYARWLLALQPTAWRQPLSYVGTSGATGYDVELQPETMYEGHPFEARFAHYGAPCLVHYLDRPPELIRRDGSEKGRAKWRPCIGVNLPDGFGNPRIASRQKRYHSQEREEYVTTGIAMSVTWSIDHDASEFNLRPGEDGVLIYPTGSITLEVRAHKYHPGPYDYFVRDRRMKPGWSDKVFLKWAARYYQEALDYVLLKAPLRELHDRAGVVIESLIQPYKDMWPTVGTQYQVNERKIGRLRAALLHWVDDRGKERDLPLFPWSIGAPSTWQQGLGGEQLHAWHKVLDQLEQDGGLYLKMYGLLGGDE